MNTQTQKYLIVAGVVAGVLLLVGLGRIGWAEAVGGITAIGAFLVGALGLKANGEAQGDAQAVATLAQSIAAASAAVPGTPVAVTAAHVQLARRAWVARGTA